MMSHQRLGSGHRVRHDGRAAGEVYVEPRTAHCDLARGEAVVGNGGRDAQEDVIVAVRLTQSSNG